MTGGTGLRRQAAKEETRRLILEAAYVLFESTGYEKTTMRALAAKANVGLGTIFQHFPSKEFLLVEAFETDVGRLVDEAMSTLPAVDIRAQLLHLAGALYEFYSRRPTLALRFIGAIHLTEGAAAEKLRSQLNAFLLLIEKLLGEARARGEMPAHFNDRDTALAFWSYYFSCLCLWLWSPGQDYRVQLEQLGRLLDQLFLRPEA